MLNALRLHPASLLEETKTHIYKMQLHLSRFSSCM
ncbi:hypothetical protein CIB84_011978 [Bambusicola thoracicus]|uniref:Uncharacterized protein n=1 Tax=Bambusicola thoracicus TaxID=9083 RepID=A0A2P4SJJ4_BAMTH|nr:hypothetical protein CIB84_011978 [Bambusicola thoracicus]